ncbi:flavodoxin domain-containing protein [Streptomyces sp. NPDC006430]|uniref:flavodoxin domain-containing protein n=1 Tax=Streptomyces sp. NPDC006430 TaxID=3154299 RepID=UPI0033A35CFE
MSVLVCYATEHGSTREITERIAARLRAADHSVEVRRLSPQEAPRPDVTRHAACIVGSAVHDGSWLAPAVAFVRAEQRALVGVPVWMFSVGMTAALPGPLRRLAARGQQRPLVEIERLLRPRDHHRFSGVIRPEHLSRTGRFLFRLLGCRYGDYVDGREIDAWADGIALALRADATA